MKPASRNHKGRRWGIRENKAIIVATALVAALALMLPLSGCSPADPEPEEKPQQAAAVIGKGRRERITPEALPPPILPDLPTGVLVMIDNLEAARPLMGIDKADIVYEIIAEGGITRYMALFYMEAADVIGPVRSARYYFVQLAKGMDLPYAHTGGAEDALSLIGNLRIKDIDEIYNAQKYFWRDSARKKPYNTYTSTEKLVEAVTRKQYAYKIPDLPPVAAEFTGQALADGQVGLTYVAGSGGYRVQWIWDEGLGDGGRYRRYINEKAQSTADGIPLVADTIMIIAAQSKARNTDPPTSTVDVVGKGDALCIVDNCIIRGSWLKESAERPLIISDSAGWPMARKQGKTWIQVVDSLEAVSFGK